MLHPRTAPEGRMSLGDHIRELRSRLLKAAIGVIAGSIFGFVFFNRIWAILREPFCRAHTSGPLSVNGCGSLVFGSVFDPILWHFKVALITGVVLSSPVWLYQIWAFVTPGLRSKERRYAIGFVASALPLFLAGATLAYFVMSKGLHLLLGFAPHGTVALISIDHYLSYALAMLLMFGAAFDVPLLVVMLNRVGVLSYARLKKSRRLSIFLVFVFAAVATPSGDPFTMIALGVPLLILLELATQIARVHDGRAAKRALADPTHNLPDDETSPLDLSTL
jgi:sec-independent protein translocase protein TatC